MEYSKLFLQLRYYLLQHILGIATKKLCKICTTLESVKKPTPTKTWY
jgi:hypothetical protein